jgi:hypothetical protein
MWGERKGPLISPDSVVAERVDGPHESGDWTGAIGVGN